MTRPTTMGCGNFEGENSPAKPRNVLATTMTSREIADVCILLHYPCCRSVPDITVLDFPTLVE